MALSRRSGRSRLTLIVLILSSVTVLTLDFRGAGVIDDVRGAAGTVFSPLEGAVDTVTNPFSDAWNGITGYDDLEAENEALRQRLDQIEGDEVRNEDAAGQLEDLAELEDLSFTGAIDTVVARVVSGPQTNFEQSIQLDKGSDDGLAEGMPVVTEAGLVGRIVSITGSRSVVQLVTEAGFDLGVRHVPSQTVGFAQGAGIGAPIRVDEGIGPSVEVEEGDALTTSGVSRSIFPPDIPVGRVTSIRSSADQLAQELAVEPLADLANLSYVRVMLWEPSA